LVIVQVDAQIHFSVFIYLFTVLYSLLPTSTRHCHQHGVTFTRSCIDTMCFSWWRAWHARNM